MTTEREGEKKKRMGKGFISGATSMLEHMCYFFHLQKNCLCNFWIKQNFCTDIFPILLIKYTTKFAKDIHNEELV